MTNFEQIKEMSKKEKLISDLKDIQKYVKKNQMLEADHFIKIIDVFVYLLEDTH